MSEPRKITQEEYDEFRSKMEEKYGYDEMSDEEKADFDSKIDQVAVVDDEAETTDDPDDPERGDERDAPPHEQDEPDDGEYVR